MAQKSRRNPFRGLMDVTTEMSRIADRMAGADAGHGPETQARGHVDAWTPATDIYAKGDDLVVRIDLTGVTREEVEVTFSNGTLSVSGKRQADDEGTVYYTRERGWGNFRRTITLPEGIRSEDIGADLDQGLLEVVIRGGATAGRSTEIDIGAKRGRH